MCLSQSMAYCTVPSMRESIDMSSRYSIDSNCISTSVSEREDFNEFQTEETNWKSVTWSDDVVTDGCSVITPVQFSDQEIPINLVNDDMIFIKSISYSNWPYTRLTRYIITSVVTWSSSPFSRLTVFHYNTLIWWEYSILYYWSW